MLIKTTNILFKAWLIDWWPIQFDKIISADLFAPQESPAVIPNARDGTGSVLNPHSIPHPCTDSRTTQRILPYDGS